MLHLNVSLPVGHLHATHQREGADERGREGRVPREPAPADGKNKKIPEQVQSYAGRVRKDACGYGCLEQVSAVFSFGRGPPCLSLSREHFAIYFLFNPPEASIVKHSV